MIAAGLLPAVLVFLVIDSTVAHSAFVRRSHLSSIPSGFSQARTLVLEDHVLRFAIGIPSNNISGLHAALLDVSDPSSPNYGRYLSKDEVARLASPKPESVTAVADWLAQHGIAPELRSLSGEMLTVHVPASRANTMLAANFTAYTHDTTNTTMIRTLSYSLPADLHDHIAFVYPTTQFALPASPKVPVAVPAKRQMRHSRGDPASTDPCSGSTTPQCLQTLYAIPTAPATSPGNSLWVSALGGDSADQNDLQTFLQRFRPDIQHGSFTVLSVNGSLDIGGDPEGNCDIQYSVGLATSVPVTYLISGNKKHGVQLTDLIDTANYLLAQDNPPLVLTTSYVFNEPGFDSPDNVQIAHMLCNAYAQLGARGTSVIVASGDGGAIAAIRSDNCSHELFEPSFPSSCPFVTSVGSTEGTAPELAANFSSGGFSNLFSRPSYQNSSVSAYLQSLESANAGRYNASGRAYPDVSTQGVNFPISVNGAEFSFTGTSASSPTFASIIALINDRLLASGKSPLGFLNPLLYSTGVGAFTDVTSGTNNVQCNAGFSADVGWDAVTGLGTPNYRKLLNAAMGRSLSENVQSGATRRIWTPRPMYIFLWTFAVGLLCRRFSH